MHYFIAFQCFFDPIIATNLCGCLIFFLSSHVVDTRLILFFILKCSAIDKWHQHEVYQQFWRRHGTPIDIVTRKVSLVWPHQV
jgi:hypothetical protein